MKIISICSGKGGSCKTTTALGLASVLCDRHKILVVDTDPQGSLSWIAAEQADAGFDVAQETDLDALGRIRDITGYKALICDTPQGLSGKSLGLIVQLSNFIVLPSTISPLDIRELTRTAHQVIKPIGTPYKVLLSRVDARRIGEAEALQQGLKAEGFPAFQGIIKNRVAFERAIAEGKLITQYKGSGGKQAADDFKTVAKELLKDLGGLK